MFIKSHRPICTQHKQAQGKLASWNELLGSQQSQVLGYGASGELCTFYKLYKTLPWGKLSGGYTRPPPFCFPSTYVVLCLQQNKQQNAENIGVKVFVAQVKEKLLMLKSRSLIGQ